VTHVWFGILGGVSGYLIVSGLWELVDNWQERRFMEDDWRERWH
jgi:hypothetical protein